MACRIALGTFAAVLLVSCSSPGDATLTTSAPDDFGVTRLPGEALDDYSQRIYYVCMDESGENTYSTMVADTPTESSFLVRSYDDTKPSTKQNSDRCGERVQQLAPAPTLTRAQLEAAYEQVSLGVQCLRDAGFDMGVTTSLDEFVARSGDVARSSLYSQQQSSGGQPFADAEWQCEALHPIPDVG